MKRNVTSFWTSIYYHCYNYYLVSAASESSWIGFLHLSPWLLGCPSNWPCCAELLTPQICPLNFPFLFKSETPVIPFQAPSRLKILGLPTEHMITSKFLLYPKILSLPTYLCSIYPWLLVVFWMAQVIMLCGFVYTDPSPRSPSLLFCLLENSILPSGLGSNANLSLWPMMTPLLLPPTWPLSCHNTLNTCLLTLYPILTLFLHFY